MRAAKAVQREVNLRAINVDVCIVRESEANAVVERENELAVGDVSFQTLGRGQRRPGSLAGTEA